jgi:hypothetical protein
MRLHPGYALKQCPVILGRSVQLSHVTSHGAYARTGAEPAQRRRPLAQLGERQEFEFTDAVTASVHA